MNRQQRSLLINCIVVLSVTSISVLVMINLKDFVNRSEAMRAMNHLSRVVSDYRKEYGLIPPESYVDRIKQNLEGAIRLGDLHYRARWIDLESTPNEILAYAEKKYPSSFLPSGYVVLRLDLRVEWMDKNVFEKLLAHQQKPDEIKLQHQHF